MEAVKVDVAAMVKPSQQTQLSCASESGQTCQKNPFSKILDAENASANNPSQETPVASRQQRADPVPTKDSAENQAVDESPENLQIVDTGEDENANATPQAKGQDVVLTEEKNTESVKPDVAVDDLAMPSVIQAEQSTNVKTTPPAANISTTEPTIGANPSQTASSPTSSPHPAELKQAPPTQLATNQTAMNQTAPVTTSPAQTAANQAIPPQAIPAQAIPVQADPIQAVATQPVTQAVVQAQLAPATSLQAAMVANMSGKNQSEQQAPPASDPVAIVNQDAKAQLVNAQAGQVIPQKKPLPEKIDDLLKAMKSSDPASLTAGREGSLQPTTSTLDINALSARASTTPFTTSQPLSSSPLGTTTPDIINIRQPEWTQKFSEQINWMVSKDIQTANIRLSPSELGPLNIQLSMNNDQLTLNIQAHHALTRETVENTLPRLREMLAENGMNQVNVDISDQQQQAQQDRSSDDDHFARQMPINDNQLGEQGEEITGLTSTTYLNSRPGRDAIDIFA